MREDVRRVLLYKQELDSGAIARLGRLHPVEAIVLAHFDGARTVREIEKTIQYLFDASAEDASAFIQGLLTRKRDCLTNVDNGSGLRYDPGKFVIPHDLIDVSTLRLYRPIVLSFRVHDDCMRDCIYCNVQKRSSRDLRLLPLGRYEELADECKDLGIAQVILSGGDPFMRDDIVRIVKLFTERSLQVFVSTKSHISEGLARQLAEIGLSRMQVSIDAADEAMADSLTRRPGSFKQMIASIRNLLRAGISVRSNCVMTRRNYRGALTLIDMLQDLGVSVVSLTSCARSLYREHAEELLLDPEEKAWLETNVRALPGFGTAILLSTPVDHSMMSPEERSRGFASRAACTGGRWGFIVHSDGKVTLCDEMPLIEELIVGDLSWQSIQEVWDSENIARLIRPDREKFAGSVCFDCDVFNECHQLAGRCFRDAYKVYGRFHAPTPLCPRAPIGPRQI
jgi:radical SAM protein with 4Fe4S-binding SPASM domain